MNSCILQSKCAITQSLCFAKYFGQPLKTVGVHCFPSALVQIPTSCYNAKKASTFCACFFAWWRCGDLNPSVAYSPKGLLHTYSAKNLCAKQLTDEQPAQQLVKFRHSATNKALKPFTTLMMPYPCPVV